MQLVCCFIRRLFAAPLVFHRLTWTRQSVVHDSRHAIRLDSCGQPVACRLDLMCLAAEMLLAES